jgi:hypothetical protein
VKLQDGAVGVLIKIEADGFQFLGTKNETVVCLLLLLFVCLFVYLLVDCC